MASFSSGCGLALQGVLGFRENGSSKPQTIVKEVLIESDPIAAEITRQSDQGADLVLGVTPLTDKIEYAATTTTRSPKVLGLLLGSSAELATGVIGVLVGRGTDTCFQDGSCFETREPKNALLITGGIALALAGIDLAAAVYHGLSKDEVIVERAQPPAIAYVARKEKFLEENGRADLAAPVTRMKLRLRPIPEAPIAAQKTDTQWVVAVMELKDRGGGTDQAALDPDLVRNVAEQIRIFAARRGYKVIDATAAGRQQQTEIEATKLESYRSCYDESCQVELGKALAASHILRASIARFGEKCVLNGELVDLRTEVAIGAASSTGDCRPEGFLNTSELVIERLLPATGPR